MMARQAQWPKPETPWPAALSLALHGGVVAMLLVLAGPPALPVAVPPAMIVEMFEMAGMAGGGGADSPVASPVAEAPVPLPAPRPEAVRRSRPQALKTPARPQETSSAAQSAASDAAAATTPATGAAGDGQSEGAGGSAKAAAGAGAGAGTGSAADMEAYLAALRQAIQRALVYPPAARRLGLAGLVRVRFQVLDDGRIDPASLVVTGGSDDDILRQGALDTIRRLSGFSPPPVGRVGVEVPVNFTLTQR